MNEENEKVFLNCYFNVKNIVGFFYLEIDYVGFGIDW